MDPRRISLLPLVAGLALLGLAGCDQPRAHGDANAIIVGADQDLWDRVQDVVEETLEPTIQTVTDERTFRVTWQDPTQGEHWGNLRRFRQVLVIGDENDPWVADALAQRDRGVTLSPPQILQVQNVWARGQQVSILLLPPDDQEAAVRSLASPCRSSTSTPTPSTPSWTGPTASRPGPPGPGLRDAGPGPHGPRVPVRGLELPEGGPEGRDQAHHRDGGLRGPGDRRDRTRGGQGSGPTTTWSSWPGTGRGTGTW
jgi:hypothetical protein